MLSEPARKKINPDFDCVEDDKREDGHRRLPVVFFAFTSMLDKSTHFKRAKCNAYMSSFTCMLNS